MNLDWFIFPCLLFWKYHHDYNNYCALDISLHACDICNMPRIQRLFQHVKKSVGAGDLSIIPRDQIALLL